MSNQGLIIEERSRDIGDFLVGRILPFRKKRMVGPFIFIDHMGPSTIKEGSYLDVGEHPHIGLSTLTYLLEGEIMHKDSIGTSQKITPGSVNWMTAGNGVVHTERTPDIFRNDGNEYQLHGFQIWVALPKSLEDISPEFHHIPENQLPKWKENNISFTLVAGEAYNETSPVPVHSHLFMLDIQASEISTLNTKNQLKGEIGICVVKGYIEACEQRIEAGNMLVSKENDTCNITLGKDTHILIFGGTPFPEDRHIFWNFVSTDKDKIEVAKDKWRTKRFKMVPGEDDYIPIPGG